MQSINARSLAPSARKWLSNTQSPRILHLFEPACNLINERGAVLSVVTPEVGDGPFNLVVEGSVSFSERLSLQSPVSVASEQLSLGSLLIPVSGAQLWNPRPDWAKLHARREDIARQLRMLPLPHVQAPGLHAILAKTPRDDIRINLDTLLSQLCLAVANADISSAHELTSRLAGLGAGLTPAGDDFIMGGIFAVWILHPVERARLIAAEMANTAAPLTTSLSAALLRSAGRGEAGILWHEFFDALVSEETSVIKSSISRLLAVGHTSGADALAGFIATTFASTGSTPSELD